MKIPGMGISAPMILRTGVWSRSGTSKPFGEVLSSSMASPGPERQATPVLVGTITRETPTISQLLYQTPLKDQCWNIIHDKVNRSKPFHRIPPGTQVHYDPESRELLWGKEAEMMLAQQTRREAAPEPAPLPVADDGPDPGRVPADLVDSARQFIGRDYEQMDCYELLVGGLTEMGVQYAGKGGLHEHLVRQASSRGLARNNYLNGEGLVSAAGTDVFKSTFHRVEDPAGTADQVMARLEPMLEQGQILSFSMRNRGHTGVVSRVDDQWTFINSGRMDNNLAGENGTKAVGEESLKAELVNWFKRSNREKQALQITLGRLDMDRLSMFGQPGIRRKV